MTSSSSYNTIRVQSSNESYLTATASAGAHVANKTITKIVTAKAAQVKGRLLGQVMGESIRASESRWQFS